MFLLHIQYIDKEFASTRNEGITRMFFNGNVAMFLLKYPQKRYLWQFSNVNGCVTLFE